MLTTAFVEAVEDNRVKLKMPQSSGCGGSELFAPPPHEFYIRRPENWDLKPGMAVRLHLPTGLSMGSSFLIFIFPLLVFLGIFLLFNFFFPNFSSMGQVLFSLLGGAFSMGGMLWILKKSSRFQPSIVAIVEGEIPPECEKCSQCCFSQKR